MTSVPDTRQIAVLPHSGDPETWFRDEEAKASESSMGDARGVNARPDSPLRKRKVRATG